MMVNDEVFVVVVLLVEVFGWYDFDVYFDSFVLDVMFFFYIYDILLLLWEVY